MHSGISWTTMARWSVPRSKIVLECRARDDNKTCYATRLPDGTAEQRRGTALFILSLLLRRTTTVARPRTERLSLQLLH